MAHASAAPAQIPVIDISNLQDRHTLAAIDRASREWGFFQVEAHGISLDAIATLHREMHAFFAQPLERKLQVSRSETNPWGYNERELTKNAIDRKEIFDCGPEGETGREVPWPNALPTFEPTLRSYMDACAQLSQRLLDALAACLHTPASQLAAAFQPRHSSFLRLNYYPADTATRWAERGELGVHPHSDAGALTLLSQDAESGLEVFRDSSWHLVEARPEALVVNIGDIVQVWSNDAYRAPLHRVRASKERSRYSAPYFFNPDYDAVYAPLPGALGTARPHYRPIRWGEFRDRRSAGDYQDLGEEVQISNYRTDEFRN